MLVFTLLYSSIFAGLNQNKIKINETKNKSDNISTNNNQQMVREIIGKYIEALGGIEKLSLIKTLIIEGSVKMAWPESEKVIKRQRILKKAPDFYRQEWYYPNRTIIMATSKFGNWQKNIDKDKILPWKFPEKSKNFQLFHQRILGPLISSEKNEHSFYLDEDWNYQEGEHVKLILKSQGKTIADLYFDKKTGLIIKKDTPGITIFYHDYKKFDGILFPCRIIEKVNNTSYQHIDLIDSIKVNVNIDDQLFKYPKFQKN